MDHPTMAYPILTYSAPKKWKPYWTGASAARDADEYQAILNGLMDVQKVLEEEEDEDKEEVV